MSNGINVTYGNGIANGLNNGVVNNGINNGVNNVINNLNDNGGRPFNAASTIKKMTIGAMRMLKKAKEENKKSG